MVRHWFDKFSLHVDIPIGFWRFRQSLIEICSSTHQAQKVSQHRHTFARWTNIAMRRSAVTVQSLLPRNGSHRGPPFHDPHKARSRMDDRAKSSVEMMTEPAGVRLEIAQRIVVYQLDSEPSRDSVSALDCMAWRGRYPDLLEQSSNLLNPMIGNRNTLLSRSGG